MISKLPTVSGVFGGGAGAKARIPNILSLFDAIGPLGEQLLNYVV